MPGPLLVVDTPFVLFRAFYGLPDSITGAGGRPVNALLGMVNTILDVVLRERPRAVVCCFGDEAAAYRVELFAGYHADRDAAPPAALDEQFNASGALVEALGWSVAYEQKLEADDLLGSLATVETQAGGETHVLTGDRDMFQCASDLVTVLWLRKGSEPERVGPRAVRRIYGIPPELVPDFIALRGDPSDGLPGAPGIGAKTAADLLQRHGSLEATLASTIGERPRVGAALREHAGALRDFKEIATLRHIDLPRPPDAPTDFTRGAAAARELGLLRLAERLQTLATDR